MSDKLDDLDDEEEYEEWSKAPPPGMFNIGLAGRLYSVDRLYELETVLPEKMELIDGKLFGIDRYRLGMASAMLEHLGLIEVVKLAPKSSGSKRYAAPKQRRRTGRYSLALLHPHRRYILKPDSARRCGPRRMEHAMTMPSDPRVIELAPTGQLRVAVILANPVLATKDPETGELRGIVIELGRELAARSGVPFVPVECLTRVAVFEGLQAGIWDAVFMAIDPARASQIDFTPPYMEVDNSYLVPSQSAIMRVTDADRSGLKVAVGRANAADLFLTRTLQHAEIVRAEDDRRACDMLRNGGADILAGSRTELLACADRQPGSRVLDDGFHVVPHAVALPQGRGAALEYVAAFLAEAVASGLVENAIGRAGLRGVRVARG